LRDIVPHADRLQGLAHDHENVCRPVRK
jgi:hypothetical protein